MSLATFASSPASSAASTSPVPPPTPLTPNMAGNMFPNLSNEQLPALDAAQQAAPPVAVGPTRRKPSRRANTAERRATHNAVERQRRETLNSRFLDLAALLPNLISVRRPSKSAIVNSSIALIHSQRRARSNAARELRLLKLEADQFRAELNDWRDQSGLGRIEESVRSREFDEILLMEESDEDLEQAERRAMDIAKETLRMDALGPDGNSGYAGAYGYDEDEEDTSSDGHSRARPVSQGPPVPSLPTSLPITSHGTVATNPMIFDPNNNFLQTHHTHHAGLNSYANMESGNGGHHQSFGILGAPHLEKMHSWPAPMFGNQWPAPSQHQPGSYHQMTAKTIVNPPTSAAGLNAFLGFDDGSDTSSVTSFAELSHLNQAALAAARTRSASLQVNLNHGNRTPPSSGPASAVYSDVCAGDAFAAAYGSTFNVGSNGWKNGKLDASMITSGTGGGSGGLHYGAAMGLFM